MRCGVPKEVRDRTRHERALERLQRRGAILPHGGIGGDDEMGRPAWFRRELAGRHGRSLLAVPSNTSIRDLEVEPPPSCGRGRRPKAPFQHVRAWCAAQPAAAWTRLTVRDGEKGPLEVEIVKRRVESKVERRAVGFEERRVAVRSEGGGELNYDSHLSNAAATPPLAELARVSKAEHRIEECLKRSKGEAGLGSYQVRDWLGWHHHMVRSLIATWFLVGEAGRGKRGGGGADGTAGPRRVGVDLSQGVPVRYGGAEQPRADAVAGAQRAGAAVPLQGT
jgi:hypothetical protein